MKQKHTYSRKQKAIRWLLRLVALILLLNVTGIYYLSPDQTISSNLQESGLLILGLFGGLMHSIGCGIAVR